MSVGKYFKTAKSETVEEIHNVQINQKSLFNNRPRTWHRFNHIIIIFFARCILTKKSLVSKDIDFYH